MGRLPDRWKSVHNPEFWINFKELYREAPRVKLLPAANLVGMFKFPYGWLTTEYTTLVDKDAYVFEEKWREKFCRQILQRSAFGIEAAKSSCMFRRRSVEEFLKNNLIREAIRYECLYVFNPKAPAYGRMPSERPANSEEFGKLNIKLSSVGHRVSRQHVIQVDTFDLLERLIEQHESRGSRAKLDRRTTEHFARRLIETWEPEGAENLTKQTIINAVADPEAGAKGGSQAEVATNEQIRPIVDDLWEEYGLGK